MSSAWTDRRRRTLGLRLAAWYLGTFLASSLLFGFLTYGLLVSSLEARDRDIIESTLREYATRYQAGGMGALARSVEIEQRSASQERLFVRVVGPYQDVLLYSAPDAWGAFDLTPLDRLPGSSTDVWDQLRAQNGAVLDVVSLVIDRGTLLQVGKTSEGRDELLARFRRVLLLGATAALAIGLTGGLLLTRSTLRPLRDLGDTVRRILRTGQTDDRVPVAGTGDALDDLGGVFNAMLARITTLIDGMRNALDNVAHDLRTPMTRLRVVAESALASDDPVRHREALSDCLEESDRALSMLTTLMDISEAETGTMQLSLTEVDVAAAIREAVALYEDAAAEKHLALDTTHVTDGPAARADAARLRQALANLIDNAVKYTPPGGKVTVEAEQEGDVVLIRIRDTGPGIAAHDLPRIWDRLYRGDHSRTTRGLGLGLSLVRASLAAQGGSIAVASVSGAGACFTIKLPNLTAL